MKIIQLFSIVVVSVIQKFKKKSEILEKILNSKLPKFKFLKF